MHFNVYTCTRTCEPRGPGTGGTGEGKTRIWPYSTCTIKQGYEQQLLSDQSGLEPPVTERSSRADFPAARSVEQQIIVVHTSQTATGGSFAMTMFVNSRHTGIISNYCGEGGYL